MQRYEPQNIEPKWQEIWRKTGLFKTPDATDKKAYVLDMFPYPSGDGLHAGHPRGYTATDVYSHFKRLTGHAVLHPMGFDAFGLPAENAAIKKKVHPAENTRANVETFRRQLNALGFSYDWSKEVNTADPAYYRWTQWIFLELFKAGLAYRDSGWQWWCPKDKTVLANEQVVEGRCERCGSEVTKKELTQWFFKITAYADELLDALEDLDWPEPIKLMQRNWIGRSEGAEVTFKSDAGDVTVYTTRPDTLYGATYLVLAPEHPLVTKLTTKEQSVAVNKYVEQAKRESDIARQSDDRKKTGVFTGSFATNPVNDERIPVWIADYVLASYGTGAIMAVPAHDVRDHEFAKKHALPVRNVLEPFYMQETEPGRLREDMPYDHRDAIIAVVRHWKEDKYLALRWKKVAWGTFVTGGIEKGQTATQAATAEILEETGYRTPELVEDYGMVHGLFYHVPKKVNRFAHARVLLFRLKDDSRDAVAQEERDKHETTWLTADELKQFLTPATHQHALRYVTGTQTAHQGEGIMVESGPYDGKTSSEARELIVEELTAKKKARAAVSYKLRDWLISRQRYWGTPIPIIHCPKCGPQPVPEKDLPVELPDVADYLPTGDGRSPLAKVKDFVRTECPKCGGQAERETDTMDTFADSSWYFLRYPTPDKTDAAFDKRAVERWLPVDAYVGGAEHAVLHLLYARFWTKALADRGHFTFREPFTRLHNQGLIMAPDGQKMSKSKGNVINPDEIIEGLGADTLRLFELFIGPFDQSADWDTKGIEGSHRFLKRVWAFGQKLLEAGPGPVNGVAEAAYERVLSKTTLRVTKSIERFRFNTAVSGLMEGLNGLTELTEKSGQVPRQYFERYLVLLAPFAPHLAEELWQQLGHEESVFAGRWPAADRKALSEDTVTIVVQVNGKVRATLDFPTSRLTEAVATEAALKEASVKKYLDGAPRKAIYVPGKLLNLVA